MSGAIGINPIKYTTALLGATKHKVAIFLRNVLFEYSGSVKAEE
jgi:hypothetical protein